MKITGISRKGRHLYLKFDNGVDLELFSMNTLSDFRLHKDKEVDSELISKIQKHDIHNYLKTRVLGYIARRDRSRREINIYLKNIIYKQKFDISDPEIVTFLDKLENDNLINDEKFSEYWSEKRLNRNKGPKLIEAELLQKGVERGTIQSVLVKIDEKVIQTACLELAEKKYPSIKAKDKYEKMNKLKRYLLSKGFDWKTVNESISKLDQ